jgi:hypothetical protein
MSELEYLQVVVDPDDGGIFPEAFGSFFSWMVECLFWLIFFVMLFSLALAVKHSLLVLCVPLALVVKRISVSYHVLFLCFYKTLECCISVLGMEMGSSLCLKK